MSSMATWLQTLRLQGQSADEVTCALTQCFSGAVGKHAREDPHHRTSDTDPKDATESRADEAQSGLEGTGQPAACGKQRIGRF